VRADYRTEKRGYSMAIFKDLLGNYTLHCHWYGLMNRKHGSKVKLFSDLESAQKEYSRIDKLRISHGYERLSP
jgi:hypothetical protein